jgi:nucleotide-binding universal stress UspA family protein
MASGLCLPAILPVLATVVALLRREQAACWPEKPVFKNILAAIDGSPRSARVLDAARRLAGATAAAVHVLHADESKVADHQIVAPEDDGATLGAVRQTLDELIWAGVAAKWEVVDVTHENLPDLVLRRARELGSDLIVLGPRHHSRIGALLGASVNHAVSLHMPMSVLLVVWGGVGTVTRTNTMNTRMQGGRAVAVVVYDGVRLLDVTGSLEVSTVANEHSTTTAWAWPRSGGRDIRLSGGVRLGADVALGNLDAPIHVLLVPGIPDVEAVAVDRLLLEQIRRLARRAECTASVCGSLCSRRSESARQHRAATHRDLAERLAHD